MFSKVQGLTAQCPLSSLAQSLCARSQGAVESDDSDIGEEIADGQPEHQDGAEKPGENADGGNEADSPADKGDGPICLDDIKGLTEAKQIVYDALINPVRHPDIYEALGVIPCRGMLLYGPPGTGKTMFGRAIANELKAEFVSVTLSETRGKTPLQTIEMISTLFSKAGMCENGCVLFFDDCEELLSRPGNSKAYGVSQFLNELDGIRQKESSKKVFVLIATNRPWMIDSALLRSGRISAAVHVGLPDGATRELIIMDALKNVPLADDVDVKKLVELTEGYSGAELFHRSNVCGVCNEARKFAARRWIEKRMQGNEERADADFVENITWADFERALETVLPVSVRDASIVQRNIDFRKVD